MTNTESSPAATETKTRAAVYVRVSTDEQAREGWSLADQEREGRDAITDRGWSHVGTYNDGGRHGDRADQRELQRLLADVGAGNVDAVVIKALDRLGRNVGEIADALALFDATRVKLIIGGRELDRETPEGNLHTDIEAVFAAYERRKIRARTRAGLKERKQAGKPMGPLAFGYTVEPMRDGNGNVIVKSDRVVNRRVPCEQEAPLVHDMFTQIAEGATPGAVGRRLNVLGVRTRRGKQFNALAVRKIVQNDLYEGNRGYPEIVDQELARSAREQLRRLDPATVQRRRGGRPTEDASFILRGLAFCTCGAPMGGVSELL